MKKRIGGIVLATLLLANLLPSSVSFAAEPDEIQADGLGYGDETVSEAVSDATAVEEAQISEDADLGSDPASDNAVEDNDLSQYLEIESYDLESVDDAQEVQGFVVTFESFDGGKVVAYDRQNLDEAVVYEGADNAIARDSETGEVDTTGSGQVNFSVILEDGYSLENISVTEGEVNFKNLKTVSQEGNVYTYRITKITGNLTVSVETKKLDDADSRALLIEELKDALKSYPKYFNVYCTQETANVLTEALDAAKAIDFDNASSEDIEGAISNVKEAVSNLQYKTAEVPQIYLSTENGKGNSLQKTTGYVNTSIVIADGSSTFTDEGASIKVRGNTTALGEKKPFNIKLSSKQDLFGMGSAKKWCLLANCFDPTLLRNYTALTLAKELGIPYTSENCFVDLWLDGVYKGSYLFTEAVEAGKTRVDVDVKGGDFILEYERERVEDGTTYITNNNGLRFSFKEPEELTDAQFENAKEALDRITAIIDSGDFSEVEKVIDIESFAKFYVLNEYMKTVDFKYSSVYFFYKDGILYAGPAWDFDLSSGNHKDNASATRDYKGAWAKDGNLFPYLWKYGGFQKAVKNVLDQYSGSISGVAADGGFIDTAYGTYRASFERNFNEAGWDISKKYSNNMMTPFATLDENIGYLKSFLYNRYLWMNQYYGNLVPEDYIELEIVRQPVSITVSKEKENAVFSVDAVGKDVGYMWFVKNPGSDKFLKSGVNSPEYTVCMYKKNDGIQAYCVITDAYGKKVTTDTATASISKALTIVKDTEDFVANKNGDKCTFRIEAQGCGVQYSWYYKKTDLAGGDGKFHKAGCFTNEYTRTASDKVDGMQVYCVITDSEGKKLVGRTATLTIKKNDMEVLYPNGKEITVASGKKAVFKVEVASGDVTYSWYCMAPEQSGGDGSFHKAGCYTSEYVRTASKKTDGMQAYCLITDASGKKVKSDIITLKLQ